LGELTRNLYQQLGVRCIELFGSPYNLVEVREIKGSSDHESVLYQTVREPKLWAFSGIGAMMISLHVSRVVVSPILIAGV
jgi:hypothetical protein